MVFRLAVETGGVEADEAVRGVVQSTARAGVEVRPAVANAPVLPEAHSVGPVETSARAGPVESHVVTPTPEAASKAPVEQPPTGKPTEAPLDPESRTAPRQAPTGEEAAAAASGAASLSKNRGLTWTTENTGKSSPAREWEASAPGARPADPVTGMREVPALRIDNPNPKGSNLVRFDGVDSDNPRIVIDRKWGVTTKPDQVDKFRSGPLTALEQNPDYRLRIEVPNRKAQIDTQRLLFYATGSKTHPQIDIVVAQK